MALSIKDFPTEQLARDLAKATGETITEATRTALEERLRRIRGEGRQSLLIDDLAAIRRRWAAMAVLDDRSADEILGFDDHGAPR